MDQEFKDPLVRCHDNGSVRRSHNTNEEMTRKEKVSYNIMQAKWRKTYRIHWAKYFAQYLKYK